MNVFILNGSPRKGGNTDVLTEQAALGAVAGGATVEKVYLADYRIEPCDACDACLRTARCKKDDDMRPLYEKIWWADAFIIGTPVYWWGVSAQTKLFIDRWYALVERREALAGKPLAVIAPHGDASPHTADHVFGMFREIAAYRDMPLVGTQWAVGRPRRQAATNTAAMAEAFELGKKIAASSSGYPV